MEEQTQNILKWKPLIGRLCQQFHPNEREDIVQTLWLEAVKAVGRYEESKAPASGLDGFVVFRLRGQVKTIKTERSYIRGAHKCQSVLRPRPKLVALPFEPATHRQCLTAEQQAELRERLALLFLRCQPIEVAAFTLLAFGRPNKEIADKLGCTLPMVTIHARRAIARLHGEDIPPGAFNGFIKPWQIKSAPVVESERRKPWTTRQVDPDTYFAGDSCFDNRTNVVEGFDSLAEWRERKFKLRLNSLLRRAGKLSRGGLTVAEYNARQAERNTTGRNATSAASGPNGGDTPATEAANARQTA